MDQSLATQQTRHAEADINLKEGEQPSIGGSFAVTNQVPFGQSIVSRDTQTKRNEDFRKSKEDKYIIEEQMEEILISVNEIEIVDV